MRIERQYKRFKRRILVIDNRPLIADSLRDLFRSAGHEAYSAHSGLQAVEVMPLRRPEVVVLALKMPFMDGFETLALLKLLSASEHVTFIAHSTQYDRETIARVKATGFHYYLKKPAPFAKFEAILSSLHKREA